MIKTAEYFEVHRFSFLAIRKPKHLVLSHPDNELSGPPKRVLSISFLNAKKIWEKSSAC